MESKTAFVWTESGIVLLKGLSIQLRRQFKRWEFSYLNSISVIDLWDTLIIFPYNTELQDTLWDLYNIKSLLIIRVTF